jgi:hypothetical protein
LLAVLPANGQVFDTWKRHVRPDGRSMFAADGPAPTEAELTEWRLWFTTAFLPNIQRTSFAALKRRQAQLLGDPATRAACSTGRGGKDDLTLADLMPGNCAPNQRQSRAVRR